MKQHRKTLAEKLRCVQIKQQSNEAFYDMFFHLIHNDAAFCCCSMRFAIFRLFNLYFRQVFPISLNFASPQRLFRELTMLAALFMMSVLVCMCQQCAIKINSPSLFFNSNFICLFMLFAWCSFYCEIAIGKTNNELNALKHRRRNEMEWLRFWLVFFVCLKHCVLPTTQTPNNANRDRWGE